VIRLLCLFNSIHKSLAMLVRVEKILPLQGELRVSLVLIGSMPVACEWSSATSRTWPRPGTLLIPPDLLVVPDFPLIPDRPFSPLVFCSDLSPPPLVEDPDKFYQSGENVHCSFSLLAQRKRTKRKGALSLGFWDLSVLLERSGARGNSLRSDSPRA
jgi:hypothetical protein